MISVKSAHRWLSAAYGLKMGFILPVIVLFYGDKGVSIGDFFLIQGIMRLFIFITEIPTGYVGDVFSRKHTLILGYLVYATGYLWWLFGSGFWFMLGGELFFSVGISLISGTLEAYLYDILKKRHKEDKYHFKLAKMTTIMNTTLMIATFSGAFIYQIFGPTAPVWLSLFCMLGATIILCFLPDVPEAKRIIAKDKSKLQDICDISKFAIKHHEIKWLMLFPALYGTLTLVFWWGLQPVMLEQNIPVFAFSVVSSAAAFIRIIWSALSGKTLDKFHLSGVIKILCITIVAGACASCCAVYVPAWATFVCLFIMSIGAGSSVLAKTANSVLINHRIKSDERATVLSVNSMIDKAFTGIGMICLKPLFDNIGIGQTFMVSALLLIPILICARHLYKMKLTTRG